MKKKLEMILDEESCLAILLKIFCVLSIVFTLIGIPILCTIILFYAWIIAVVLIAITVFLYMRYEVICENKIRFSSRKEKLEELLEQKKSSITDGYTQLEKILIDTEESAFHESMKIRDKLRSFLISSTLCLAFATIISIEPMIDLIMHLSK